MLVVAKNTIKVSLSMAISAFGETPTISENLERQLRIHHLVGTSTIALRPLF
jgi:hypothetical protein